MTDRYEKIRKALAMGPTPGPYRQSEHTPQRVDTGDGSINIGWACNFDNGARESRAEATAALIAACDPDTIRAMLEENDGLTAENARLRAEVERLNRILGRIVEGDGDSTLTIRTGTDAFAAAREYLLRDQEEEK